MRHVPGDRALAAALAAVLLAACGTTAQTTSGGSPSTGTPTPTATMGASPSPGESPSPAPADIRLVIDDFNASQVRLARLDATDTATVIGHFVGIVNDQVIVLNVNKLSALNRKGTSTKLGQLAATPEWAGVGTVVVNPQLTQWLYAIRDDASTARIHLGTATSDRVIATLPSPDGNAYYQPFAWNASGVYMVRQPVGIGGAGPFLEYHFPLAKFDLASARVTDVSPECIVLQVLEDGTMLCRGRNPDGRLEVRSPSGGTNVIQMASGTSAGDYGDGSYIRVVVSPDGRRVVAGRNGAKSPVINYQMAIADLTSSSAGVFGPIDYLPDAWLPDGRVVADHFCAYSGFGGGPCDASLDATYFFSADGTSRTLFFKLTHGAVVGYV